MKNSKQIGILHLSKAPLSPCQQTTPAQQPCEAIYDTLVGFQQGTPQYDDVTLLAVRRLISK